MVLFVLQDFEFLLWSVLGVKELRNSPYGTPSVRKPGYTPEYVDTIFLIIPHNLSFGHFNIIDVVRRKNVDCPSEMGYYVK